MLGILADILSVATRGPVAAAAGSGAHAIPARSRHARVTPPGPEAAASRPIPARPAGAPPPHETKEIAMTPFTQAALPAAPAAPAALIAALRARLAAAWAAFAAARAARRSAADLARLDDRLLRDVGLMRWQADRLSRGEPL